MPKAAPRPCTVAGCGVLVAGGGRCPAHPIKAWTKRASRDGTTTERGYGHAWRKLRRQILERDNYLCQISLREGRVVAAVTVDHVINKATWLDLHGTLAGVDEPTNLQSLCKEEHTKKTLAEAREGARGLQR